MSEKNRNQNLESLLLRLGEELAGRASIAPAIEERIVRLHEAAAKNGPVDGTCGGGNRGDC